MKTMDKLISAIWNNVLRIQCKSCDQFILTELFIIVSMTAFLIFAGFFFKVPV